MELKKVAVKVATKILGKSEQFVLIGKKENSDEKSEQENICNEEIEVEEAKVKLKSKVIKEIGLTQKQALQLQQPAKNPECKRQCYNRFKN